MKVKSVNDVRYSRQLSDMSSYVFIDGVCVKSRMGIEEKPSVEEALATNHSVLVQTEEEIKIHVDNKGLEHYKRWINHIAKSGHDFYKPMLWAFKNGFISIINNGHKVIL